MRSLTPSQTAVLCVRADSLISVLIAVHIACAQSSHTHANHVSGPLEALRSKAEEHSQHTCFSADMRPSRSMRSIKHGAQPCASSVAAQHLCGVSNAPCRLRGRSNLLLRCRFFLCTKLTASTAARRETQVQHGRGSTKVCERGRRARRARG